MEKQRYLNSLALVLSLTMCLPGLGGEASSDQRQTQPIGWASIGGGVSGGQGGTKIVVEDAASFVKHVQSGDPAIVQISGTIRLHGSARVGSNKTIVGLGPDARIAGGGLKLRRAKNVVIQNLAIQDSPEDAVSIEDGSQHVWVDHCDFSDCHDGLVDIKQGSDLITVSWNRFASHQKTCLLGHSDDANVLDGDRGKLRVTYHHNFFDGTASRHPRVRVADPVHVFNNYFRNNEYGVASTMDAGVLVEGNYFENVERPTHTQYGDSPDPGRLVERHNVYVESGAPLARGTVPEPKDFYAYELDEAKDIPAIVSKGAGAGKITR